MASYGRRRVLGMGGALAFAAAGCARSSSRSAEPGHFRWWDHFEPLSELHEEVCGAFADAHDGVEVETTVYNAADLAQALQLAHRSGQQPDVHTTAGLGLPEQALYEQGWIAPLRLTAEQRARIDDDALVEGLHLFDGTLYSFPLFTFRQHSTLTWFNRELVERAGGDPAHGPATWDEFRALARRITADGDGEAYGWIQGLAFVDRLETHLIELAQAAGAVLSHTSAAPPLTGMADPLTGAYVFDSEPFVEALEFLRSLVDDDVVFPAATSLDAQTARARWATGVAGFFFDGPWNIGVVLEQLAPFADSVGVADVPSPEGRAPLYKGPAPGQFWLSGQCRQPRLASRLIGELTSEAYARGLAECQDQPPLREAVVAEADVHPTYRRAVELFQRVLLAPTPIGRNPAVGSVISAMQDVRPSLGEIVQGYLGGDIADARAALRTFNGALEAERERALRQVTDEGGVVGPEDWVFDDFVPGQDYGTEHYAR